MKAKHIERAEGITKLGDDQKTLAMLMGYKGSYRYDEELFRRIAECFERLESFPQAGLYRLMTASLGGEATRSIEAAKRHYGDRLPEVLPIHLPVSELPESVRRSLFEKLREAGIDDPENSFKTSAFRRRPYAEKAILVGCGVLATGLLIVFLFGIYFIISLLVAFLRKWT